jgi:hypothetical protein
VVGFGTTDVHATQGFGVKRKTDVPVVSQGCNGKVKGKSEAAVYGCHRDREIGAGKPISARHLQRRQRRSVLRSGMPQRRYEGGDGAREDGRAGCQKGRRVFCVST